MRRNLQDLVDRVCAEGWDQYLPAPSTVRGGRRRPMPHRSLAIVGAAALVVAAVVVPATLAQRVGSDRSRPAASGSAAAPAPCTAAFTDASDLMAALLTPADAVPGYSVEEEPKWAPLRIDLPKDRLLLDVLVPGMAVGQLGNAYVTLRPPGDRWGFRWGSGHQVFRYSSGAAADAAYAAAVKAVRATALAVVTDRGGAEAEFIVKAPNVEPPLAPRWAIVTRSGDCVIAVDVGVMLLANEVAPDGPGLAYLESLASAARAKAVGRTAPKLPLPAKQMTSTVPVPKGYLELADLGAGTWSVETMNGNTERTDIPLSTADCKDGGKLPLTQPGTLQPYRGQVKDQQWSVVELVLRLSIDDARKFMTAERAYEDSTCSPTEVVASPSGVGDEMFIIHKTGQNGQQHVNKAWVRIGGTVIHLNVGASHVDTSESVPIPDANAYLTSVARQAITRAQAG